MIPGQKPKNSKLQQLMTKTEVLLERFDLLGESVKLRYKGRTTVHTTHGGFLSLIFVGVWLYFMLVKGKEFLSGSSGQLSSTTRINNVAGDQNLVQLYENGFDNETLKIGVNVPNNTEFNNVANKYMVFRAYMIDNEHNVRRNLKLNPCSVHKSRDRNEKWKNKAFCVDPGYDYLRGNYDTDVEKSQIMQVRAIICDKQNDPENIFINIPRCASEFEMAKFLESNVFVSMEENKIDYEKAQASHDGPTYMRRHFSIKYDHLWDFTNNFYESFQINLQLNTVQMMNQGWKPHDPRYFLNSQHVEKSTFLKGHLAPKNTLFDIVLTMTNEGVVHQIAEYNIFQLCIDFGGFTLCTYAVFYLISCMISMENLESHMAPRFYRKPEIYKYAHATKLDMKLVVDEKMTLEEYNDLQYQENLDSMEKRTYDEMKGTIRKPSCWAILWFHILDQFSLERDFNTIVDERCYRQAVNFVQGDMLDIDTISKEVRQNKYLKQALFNQSQIMRLDEHVCNVIDPRKNYVGGQAVLKKKKMTDIEKKLAETYVDEDSSEDSEEDMVDKYVAQQFKDFTTDDIKEKTIKQHIFLWKENEKLMNRVDNILKINTYDKQILQRDVIRDEKAEFRRIAKILLPQIQAKKKREEKGIVVPLAERLRQFQKQDRSLHGMVDDDYSRKRLANAYEKLMVAQSLREGENLDKLNLNGDEAKQKWPALSLLTFKLGKGIEEVLPMPGIGKPTASSRKETAVDDKNVSADFKKYLNQLEEEKEAVDDNSIELMKRSSQVSEQEQEEQDILDEIADTNRSDSRDRRSKYKELEEELNKDDDIYDLENDEDEDDLEAKPKKKKKNKRDKKKKASLGKVEPSDGSSKYKTSADGYIYENDKNLNDDSEGESPEESRDELLEEKIKKNKKKNKK